MSCHGRKRYSRYSDETYVGQKLHVRKLVRTLSFIFGHSDAAKEFCAFLEERHRGEDSAGLYVPGSWEEPISQACRSLSLM